MGKLKTINTSAELAEMLAMPQALLLLRVNASGTAEETLNWLAARFEGQGSELTRFRLNADEHTFAWRCVDEFLPFAEPGALPETAVVWLKQGKVADVMAEPTPDQGRWLDQKTSVHFGGAAKPEQLIDPKLLDVLCCPETRQPLRWASAEILNRLNARYESGALKNRGGEFVKQVVSAGLVRADGQYLYPLQQNVPVLITAEGIPLT